MCLMIIQTTNINAYVQCVSDNEQLLQRLSTLLSDSTSNVPKIAAKRAFTTCTVLSFCVFRLNSNAPALNHASAR